VILIHRRDGFRAAPASVAKMKELCDAMRCSSSGRSPARSFRRRAHRPEGDCGDAVTRLVPADVLLVFFGLSPKLTHRRMGLDLERKQVVVDTEKFETNVPGIRRRRRQHLSGQEEAHSRFHEAALAVLSQRPSSPPDKRILPVHHHRPKLHKVPARDANFD
jgi:thioredoxin reductase (NADPH)